MSLHKNNGKCEYCQKIFERYPGFYVPLQTWFDNFQLKHPEAHISCAGRGRIDQEECLMRGTSKACYGQSAHNKNCAIDLFINDKNLGLYNLNWFRTVLWPELLPSMSWLGAPGSKFYELAHVEMKSWYDIPGLNWVEPL